jgi:carbamate kinase
MTEKLAVVAIGGNSIIKDTKNPNVHSQWSAVRETCFQIADMIAEGWNVVVTHGNGPQVGYILRRSELAKKVENIHEVPLDLIVADTQGSIGYMLQSSLGNILRQKNIQRSLATVVTQVVVDLDDPAFHDPTKPIGGFMEEADARRFEDAGYSVVEDAGRGWRRVVASPSPKEIYELEAIKTLLDNNHIVVAVGGGGIPVVYNDDGNLVSSPNAVIDKDRASGLLAQKLNADLLMISTAVEKVKVNFNKPDQYDIDKMTAQQAQQYAIEGNFAKGSMLPKIEAAIEFVKMGGSQVIITNPPNLVRALRGETGTCIAG